MEARQAAALALDACDPAEKVRRCLVLADRACSLEATRVFAPGEIPGRPGLPMLVSPQQVPRRRPGSPQGRAALIHAIAHIEFNAINLALDAVVRFHELPDAFYRDWLQVAAEEASHFSLLAAHLGTLGHAYGDFPAHDGLWEAARRTRKDVLARMALVPRVLEARGLDVTPAMQARLRAAGDGAAADILDIILRDEVGHVAIGNRWFHWLCGQRQVQPQDAFRQLCTVHGQSPPRAPFNTEARLAGGFTPEELAEWAGEEAAP
jgi:uncharacterized ferritin-like protein (DUF455 family)